MKQLKDYIGLQKFTGMSDMEIITAYFIDNDIEEEAMEVSHKLAKVKIEKMKQREDIIRTWAYTIPSDYLYENYPVDIAGMLHRIELDYIVNGKVTGNRLNWAKENFENIEMPSVYFQPCLGWLEKHDVRFKEN